MNNQLNHRKEGAMAHNSRRRRLVTFIATAISLALLSACSSGGVSVQDLKKLTDPINITSLSCDDATGTLATMDTIKAGSEEDKATFAKRTGLKLDDSKKSIKMWDKTHALLVVQRDSICDPGTSSIVVDEETIKALSIITSTFACKVDAKGLVVFPDIDRSKWYADDSYATKLSSSPDRKELQARMCDPVQGVVFMHWLTNLKFANWSMVDGNPWLQELADKFDGMTVHEITAYYMPLVDVTKPADAAVQVSVVRNREWRQVANKLGTLLEQPKVEGVESLVSAKNYHAPGWELGLPSVVVNDRYEENLPAFVFVMKNKMGTCNLRFGFNMKDARLEQFNCAAQVTVKTIFVPTKHKPNKHGKCPPGEFVKNGKCIIAKNVHKAYTPQHGLGGNSPGLPDPKPSKPAVTVGAGATSAPTATQTPRPQATATATQETGGGGTAPIPTPTD